MECYFVHVLLAAVLWIQDSKSLTIVPRYSKVVARQGSDVTLECTSDSIDPVDSYLKWTKDGKNIKDNAKTRIRDSLPDGRNGFSLNIKNVSKQDTGEYECVVNIQLFQAQMTMKATRELQIFQKVLYVTASQTNVTIVEGSTTTLQCQLTYSDAINVSIFWLFEGKQMKSRLLHKGNVQDLITINKTPLSLELTQATRKQGGIYTCGALSPGLQSSLNISVNVTDAEGPELARIGKDVQVFAKGKTVSLSCDAIFPAASFVDTFWTFNGGRIASNERRRKYDENNQESTLNKDIRRSRLSLTIYDVGLNDTGIYACNLNTSHGMAQKNFSIFVKPKVLKVTASQTNVTIEEGSTTTLQCQLTYSGAINVSIFWLFEGKQIKDRPLHKRNDQDLITTHATVLSLKLTRATRKQGGIYTCGALSPGLQSSLNISVSVTDAEGPELARIGKDVQVFAKGKTASLSCDAIFPAASFVDTFWTLNGGRIASKERRRKYDENNLYNSTLNEHIRGSRLSLKIYDVGLNDTGIYVCNLNTSHGMAQKNFSIFVEPKEDPRLATATDERNPGFTGTMLFISLGLFVGLLTTVIVYLKLRSRRPPIISPDKDKDKDHTEFDYDVFVTYSRKDSAWVDQDLLPLLEKNDVKYCVDYLHFPLGKAFLESMADGVYNSRKVLAVYSKNFANGKYPKQELDLALQRSFDLGDSAVIVIRIDDINPKRLPKALRGYTFLDFYDSVERKGWEKRLIKHLKVTTQRTNVPIGTSV